MYSDGKFPDWQTSASRDQLFPLFFVFRCFVTIEYRTLLAVKHGEVKLNISQAGDAFTCHQRRDVLEFVSASSKTAFEEVYGQIVTGETRTLIPKWS